MSAVPSELLAGRFEHGLRKIGEDALNTGKSAEEITPEDAVAASEVEHTLRRRGPFAYHALDDGHLEPGPGDRPPLVPEKRLRVLLFLPYALFRYFSHDFSSIIMSGILPGIERQLRTERF
ncbi:MAG: hypothetical protein R3B51_09305 [Thermodesulfobacteriota bacterium]